MEYLYQLKPHHDLYDDTMTHLPHYNYLLHPCWWDTDIAANVNAAQLVLELCATHAAQQPVGNWEAYYNSNRRLDILRVLCRGVKCTLEMSC